MSVEFANRRRLRLLDLLVWAHLAATQLLP